MKFLISVLFFVATLSASTAGEALFGVEFEFQNAETDATEGIAHSVLKKYQSAMKEKVVALCARERRCKITTSPRKGLISMDYVITYEDGWSWRLSTDNGTIEIQTAPATVAQFEAMSERIQTDIFDVAAECTLLPNTERGAGHIHIGVKSGFKESPLILRNFLVDRANHPELALGIFNHDASNAPPIAALSKKQQHDFAKVISDFDTGKIPTLVSLAKAVDSRVYYTNPAQWTPTEKYQDTNLTRIEKFAYESDRQTVELRGFAAQTSVDVFLKEIKLIQSRLDFLEGIDGRVGLRDELATPTTQLESTKNFYRFVTETGLAWKDFKEFAKGRFAVAVLEHAEKTIVLPHTSTTLEASVHDYVASSPSACMSLLRFFNKLRPSNLIFFGY